MAGGAKHDCILADEDNDDQNTFDDEVESKKTEPKQKKARKAGAPAPPQNAAEGDPSAALGYAKEQHEKATADLDHIIKFKIELEMEYAKALYTAFDTERKLEVVSATIGSTPSSADPLSQTYV